MSKKGGDRPGVIRLRAMEAGPRVGAARRVIRGIITPPNRTKQNQAKTNQVAPEQGVLF